MEENIELGRQLTALLDQCEEREKQFAMKAEEQRLQAKLHEAQLAKAKIEKAEMNADFTKERLEFHKAMLEANEQRDDAMKQLRELKEQVDIFEKQYAEMERTMKEDGTGKKQVRIMIFFKNLSFFMFNFIFEEL